MVYCQARVVYRAFCIRLSCIDVMYPVLTWCIVYLNHVFCMFIMYSGSCIETRVLCIVYRVSCIVYFVPTLRIAWHVSCIVYRVLCIVYRVLCIFAEKYKRMKRNTKGKMYRQRGIMYFFDTGRCSDTVRGDTDTVPCTVQYLSRLLKLMNLFI